MAPRRDDETERLAEEETDRRLAEAEAERTNVSA